MSFPRFYSNHIIPHSISQLPSEEAAHASVLRLKTGDRIVVFNGSGDETEAVIVELTKKSLIYRAEELLRIPRTLPGRVCVAVSLPKGERQRSVVEKLVEMGIHELIPIQTRRSVASVSNQQLERYSRWSLETCKQSGRNAFLTIHPSIDFGQLILDQRWQTTRRWIAHPFADEKGSPLDLQQLAEPSLFCIGPEGGFTEEERDAAFQSGFRMLVLGDRILRVETAVTYVCAMAAMALQPPRSSAEFS